MPSSEKIQALVEAFGFSELQAYRHIKAQQEIERAGYVRARNWLKFDDREISNVDKSR